MLNLAKGHWGWDDRASAGARAALRSEAREAPDARGPRDATGVEVGNSNRGQIEEKNIQKSEEIPRNDDTTEKMFIIVHTVPVLASNDLVLDLFSIHHGLQMCVGLLPCLLGHVRATMFRL